MPNPPPENPPSSSPPLFCWLAGFKYAKAGVVALLNQTSTILIVVFAALFLKEPLTRLKVLAVIIAVIGAMLVLSSSP